MSEASEITKRAYEFIKQMINKELVEELVESSTLKDGAKQIQKLTEYKLALSTELTAYMVAVENQKDTIEKYRSALQKIADDETDYPKSVAKEALEI